MPKQTYVVIEEGMIMYTDQKSPVLSIHIGTYSFPCSVDEARQLHADLGKVLEQIAEEKE